MNGAVNKSLPIDLLKVLGVALLYVLLAVIFLNYIAPEGVASVVWPPSGLALAAVLIGGRRYAFGVLIGAFIANGLTSHHWLLAAPIAMGNMLEALLGAWLLMRNGTFNLAVQSLRDYFRLVFLAGCIACSVAALNGATVLLLAGVLSTANYMHNLLHWWMGDVLGVVLITPLILVFWRKKIAGLDVEHRVETVLLLACTFVLGQILFLGWFDSTIGVYADEFLMFICVAWAALRLGRQATVMVLLMTATQGLLGAYQGIGYFDRDLAETGLVSYWFYMMVLSVVGMALAVYFDERGIVEQKTLTSERKFRAIIEISPIPYGLTDEHGNVTFLNPAFIHTFGYTLADLPTLTEWGIKAYPDPEYREWVLNTWRAETARVKSQKDTFEPIEVSIRCKNGAVKTVMASISSI